MKDTHNGQNCINKDQIVINWIHFKTHSVYLAN